MLQLSVAFVPIPVHQIELDSVFDRPFDLPIDDFRAGLVVPSEQRASVGATVPDSGPGMSVIPAGEIQRTDFVFGFHRFRFRHVVRLRKIQRRQDADRDFYRNAPQCPFLPSDQIQGDRSLDRLADLQGKEHPTSFPGLERFNRCAGSPVPISETPSGSFMSSNVNAGASSPPQLTRSRKNAVSYPARTMASSIPQNMTSIFAGPCGR